LLESQLRTLAFHSYLAMINGPITKTKARQTQAIY
jgi:hypothetical protein